MVFFKVYMLFALIYITGQAGSEPAGQIDSQNRSVVDYPVTVPIKILKALVEISHKSNGLILLWRNSFSLTEDSLLKAEVSFKYAHTCS